jgi:regulatory protein SWI5
MEETLKPVRTRTENRTSGIFQDLRQQAESMAHTPPRANAIPMAINGLRTPEFMNMRNISEEFRKIEREFGSMPTSPADAPGMFSFLKSQDAFNEKPEFQFPSGFESQGTIPPLGPPSPTSQTPSRRGSPHHRRTESIASITSAASIADINIEETKTETGVTIEDIAQFIQGPDPSDGKWRCLYEGCNKPFGRKENIKSHVQTHLNDRQYQCPHCRKCFVRQHDLKRHAKIHTGIKPYPCECGNSFARHDALTRHRQRGMCIGAFDGVVRKVVKRGRPKKIRPDMDERRDKAVRTRRKNTISSTTSASSQSGYSDISAANSPGDDFDGLLDDEHFPGLMSSSISSLPSTTTTTMDPATLAAVSTAPIPTTTLAEVFRSLSPSATSSSTYSNHTSPILHHHTLHHHHHHQQQPPIPPTTTTTDSKPTTTHRNPSSPEYPPSPTKSTASHYTHGGTPPDLSSPRSPPPVASSSATRLRFFDLDPDQSGSCLGSGGEDPDVSIGLGTTVAAHAAAAAASSGGSGGFGFGGGGLEQQQQQQHEMLLGFHEGSHSHFVGLDGSGGMGLGGGGMKFEKFEDEFDPVCMFTHGEDVFFGTA